MWAHLWRIDVAFQRGDLGAVGRELEPLARCVEEVRGPVARWHLLQCRAVLAQAQGRFADARRPGRPGVGRAAVSATGYGSAVINRTGCCPLSRCTPATTRTSPRSERGDHPTAVGDDELDSRPPR